MIYFIFTLHIKWIEDEVRVYPEKRKESVAFVQSNFEPDIGLRGVFECDDTKLYWRIPKLEYQDNGHYYSECSVEISVGYPLNTSEYLSARSK